MFTDYIFDNLGVPQNPENPAGVAPDSVDPGLGGFLENAGYFKTLEGIVHFYNTRDVSSHEPAQPRVLRAHETRH